MPQNLNYHVSVEWENCEWHIKMHTKYLRACHNHVCPSTNTRSVVQQTRSHIVTKTFSDNQKHGQSAVQDPVYALICVLYTQTLTEDQIEDTREHAYPNNFRRHGGSHFQRNCDLTDSHHVCLSTTLITIPQPVLPSSFKLPSQKPRVTFHVVGVSFL